MGAYLIWYTVVPTTYNGKIFSDALTRLAFLFLLLLSTPVGIHHQFLEPGISAGWKWLHMLMTYGVVVPSFMTAFAIFASFELAARAAGKKGFLQTVAWLPWRDPAFSGTALGMILFIFGGFGGIVNASYSMDILVHNTMWIVGHFHITVGGPVALSFIGAAYRLVPAVTGRKLFAPKLALLQTWLWFIGMVLMSTAMHIAGLLGSPRRTSDVTYFGAAGAQSWHGEMVVAGIGGAILFTSIILFVIVAVGTRLRDEHPDERPEFAFATAHEGAMQTPAVLDRVGSWAALAIALAVIVYVGPIHDQLSQHHFLAPGMRTW
jgi:cytochrome c oxidase subunit I